MLKEITTDKIEIQDIQNSKQFYNTEVDFDAYKKHKDELEKEWNALGKENQKEFGTIKKFFQDKLPPYSDEELNRARHYSLENFMKAVFTKLLTSQPDLVASIFDQYYNELHLQDIWVDSEVAAVEKDNGRFDNVNYTFKNSSAMVAHIREVTELLKQKEID